MLKEFLQSCLTSTVHTRSPEKASHKRPLSEENEHLPILEKHFLNAFAVVLHLTVFYIPAFELLKTWISPAKTIII